MNKEEIEKEDKEHLIEILTEHKDYIFEFDDDNIKIEYILDYIRELEFKNTALKAEHNHNITRIKKLEQKESILDKVTDKLKEDIDFLEFSRDRDMENGYGEDEEDRAVRVYIESILNIIEGGDIKND